MPYVTITIAGQALDQEQTNTLIAETTRLMHEVLGKRVDVTSVRVEEVSGQSWAIGGALVGEGGFAAAHMDIKVTAGTNTADEKAAMVAAGYRLMQDVVERFTRRATSSSMSCPPTPGALENGRRRRAQRHAGSKV